jgi:apolipoprotein N-acyltransferase
MGAKVSQLLRRLRHELVTYARLYSLSALSGGLYAAGFCGFDQHYLAWICLVPQLWVLQRADLTPRRAFYTSWVTGMVAHLGCYTWIVYMLRHFAYLPWPLALLGYALLCLAQSLLLAVWGLLAWLCCQRGRVSLLWTAPVSMVVAEWLFPALFPSYLANSQYRQPLVLQSLEVWGALGLTFVLVLSCALVQQLGSLIHRRRLPGLAQGASLALATAVCVGNAAYGHFRLDAVTAQLSQATRKVRVGMVQTNMGIYEKTDNPEEGLRRHQEQSLQLQARGVDLIIWPESGYYYGIYDGTQNVAQAVLGPVRTPLLFGGLRIAGGPGHRRLYNTAFLTDAAGTLLSSYDKTFLLAFGEYMPLGELWPSLYKLLPQTPHTSRGSHLRPLTLAGIRYGMLICYEDILPSFARQVAKQDPDVLVNLTNDAWFGPGHEPSIHLALGLFRAVEHRRYLLRATNTGISSIIEPTGRVQTESAVFERASVEGTFSPQRKTTFYGRFGDWLGYLCVGLLAVWLGRSKLTLRRSGPSF